MKTTNGYVYLICDPGTDKFKIGVTTGPIENRIKKLQTGNPTELFISAYHKTDYPFRIETMLHNKYKSFNVLNEWFDLPPSEIFGFNKTCNEMETIISTLKENPFFTNGLK